MNTLKAYTLTGFFKRIPTVFLFGICMLLFGINTFAAPAFRCEYLVSPDSFRPQVKTEELNSNYLLVNDVAVTGEFIYNLKFVYGNLKISTGDIVKWHGKKIVSLAEGVSGLVPSLLRNGLDATGVDLVYQKDGLPNNHSGNLVREYMGHYGANLIQADARRTPFADGSVDVLLSHMLVNNVNSARKQSILREVMRLLNPKSGEARLYGFDVAESSWVIPFVTKTCGDCSVVQFEPVVSDLTFNGRTSTVSENILVIKRQSK